MTVVPVQEPVSQSEQTVNKRPWGLVTQASRRISTREAFSEALTQVNALVRREDISIPEAKETLSKAEALRAWASFDKRLTVDEKKEANRAMTRTVLMLGRIAEKEQPVLYAKGLGKGKTKLEGPVKWLMREIGFTRAKANFSRKLLKDEERTRAILDLGAHWLTALGHSSPTRGIKHAALTRMGQWVIFNNSLIEAMKVHPPCIGRELTRIRNIKAWCEAYESALLQRKSRAILRPTASLTTKPRSGEESGP